MLSKLKEYVETVDPQVQIRLRLRTEYQLTLNQIQLEYIGVISVNFSLSDTMIQIQTINVSEMDCGLFFVGLLGIAKLCVRQIQEEIAKLEVVGC